MNFIDWLKEFIKENSILSIVTFLGGIGGFLRFYWNIQTFSDLKIKVSKIIYRFYSSIFLPLSNFIFHILKLVFRKVYYIFFESRHKHFYRLPIYVILIISIFLQYREYMVRKKSYKVAIIVGNSFFLEQFQDSLKKQIKKYEDNKPLSIKIEIIKNSSSLVDFDLIVSCQEPNETIYTISRLRPKSKFIDLFGNYFLKEKVFHRSIDENIFFSRILPTEEMKLNIVLKNIDTTNSVLFCSNGYLSSKNIPTTMPIINIPYNDRVSEYISTFANKKKNFIIAGPYGFSNEIALIFSRLNLTNKNLIFIHPKTFFEVSSMLNTENQIFNVVPLNDTAFVSKLMLETKNKYNYFNYLNSCMYDFTQELFIKIQQEGKLQFDLNKYFEDNIINLGYKIKSFNNQLKFKDTAFLFWLNRGKYITQKIQ